MRSHARDRTVFGIACLFLLGLTAFLGTGAPFANAAETFPGQGFLPHHRAWEMVSPPDKNGADVIAETSRTRAAADGDAVDFLSLGGFGEVRGIVVGTDYMAVRSDDPSPGYNGWQTHGITPETPSLPYFLVSTEPRYMGAFSDDLTKGVFAGFGGLTGYPYTEGVPNLHLRTDATTPGAGAYELVTRCPLCESEGQPLPPTTIKDELISSTDALSYFAGANPAYDRVVFESRQPLTADENWAARTRVYEWHGGTVRLVGRIPAKPATSCDDEGPQPCVPVDVSIGGAGAGSNHAPSLTPHIVSDGSDGHTRIFFTRPTETGNTSNAGGSRGDVYARVDGTSTVQLNAVERQAALGFRPATYLDATPDGTRVFLTSAVSLTDQTSVVGVEGLYVYDADDVNDETQRLTVNATAGQFKLKFDGQTTADIPFDAPAGVIENELESLSSIGGVGGSVTVSGGPGGVGGGTPYLIVFGGSLAGSDQPQIATQPGTTPLSSATTTIMDVDDETQRLTVNATAGQFKLKFDGQTTADIPFNAPAGVLESELESLSSIGGVGGSVTVSGGPGGAGGGTPYLIVFGGSLAGSDQPLITSEPGTTPLSGATASATMRPYLKGGGHLTQIDLDREPADGGAFRVFLGASDDGRSAYFMSTGQLVQGEPLPSPGVGLFAWHDGTVTYIGAVGAGTANENATSDFARQSRVSRDGRWLLFSSNQGEQLTGYDHGVCDQATEDSCRELYLYDADSDALRCVSCNPSGATDEVMATTRVRTGAGGAQEVWGQINRALSADGRYAFFSTAERLVAEDTNGTSDAYVFDSLVGKSRLLSSGEDKNPSYFLDASADGEDAFFLTRERLSKWDVDNNFDIYDARVDGGFPEPPPTPSTCQGDGCQPAPRVLDDPTPGSASVTGPGDPPARTGHGTRCPRGKRRVKAHNGKSRCVKRGVRDKRNADTDRRAAR